MRTIKFRCWDKERKTWGGITSITIGLDGKIFDSVASAQDRYELNQFTGLLDKNGKEIYEGDLVAIDINKTLHKVLWIEDLAAFNLVRVKDPFKDSCFPFDCCEREEHYEVIGNIYENPSLLDERVKGI